MCDVMNRVLPLPICMHTHPLPGCATAEVIHLCCTYVWWKQLGPRPPETSLFCSLEDLPPSSPHPPDCRTGVMVVTDQEGLCTSCGERLASMAKTRASLFCLFQGFWGSLLRDISDCIGHIDLMLPFCFHLQTHMKSDAQWRQQWGLCPSVALLMAAGCGSNFCIQYTCSLAAKAHPIHAQQQATGSMHDSFHSSMQGAWKYEGPA